MPWLEKHHVAPRNTAIKIHANFAIKLYVISLYQWILVRKNNTRAHMTLKKKRANQACRELLIHASMSEIYSSKDNLVRRSKL
jgi:hypothetical protein